VRCFVGLQSLDKGKVSERKSKVSGRCLAWTRRRDTVWTLPLRPCTFRSKIYKEAKAFVHRSRYPGLEPDRAFRKSRG
jgi:hypothetical protein